MRIFLSVYLLSLATVAHADLAPKAGSEAWCTSYETTRSGVWLFPDGQEALLFRAGISGQNACYAWLNDVPEWNLEAGQLGGQVDVQDGALVIIFPSGVEVHIFDDGKAEYRVQGGVTAGLMTD